MALPSYWRAAAVLGAAASLLLTFHGNALAQGDVPSCCIEQIASGGPMALGHASQGLPKSPSLNLTLKLTVTVEVRRVTRHGSPVPAVEDRPAATDANGLAAATR